jgi:Calx-beta domain
VTVSGLSIINVFLGECGNAYADGTPLAAGTRSVLTDCSVPLLGFGPGQFVTNGTYSLPVREHGLGAANRSCVINAPDPCVIYLAALSSGSNSFPTLAVFPISFAQDVAGTTQSTTAEAVAPSLSVGAGKSFALHVQVLNNSGLRPDGTFSVNDGASTLASGTLPPIFSPTSVAVTVPSMSVGTHQLFIHYDGNGSFFPSDSDAISVNVIAENSISIGDVTAWQGTSGTRSARFPVVLTNPSATKVTVRFQITGVTATTPGDFRAASLNGTLGFPAGTTTRWVYVHIVGHATAQPTRTFTVTLSNPSPGYDLNKTVGTGTILDGGQYASIQSATTPEGDSGHRHTVQLVVTNNQGSGVSYVIRGITAKQGPQTDPDADFGGRQSGIINFPTGVTKKILTIGIWPDTRAEGDETFVVAINGATPTLPTGPNQVVAVVTILGDE